MKFILGFIQRIFSLTNRLLFSAWNWLNPFSSKAHPPSNLQENGADQKTKPTPPSEIEEEVESSPRVISNPLDNYIETNRNTPQLEIIYALEDNLTSENWTAIFAWLQEKFPDSSLFNDNIYIKVIYIQCFIELVSATPELITVKNIETIYNAYEPTPIPASPEALMEKVFNSSDDKTNILSLLNLCTNSRVISCTKTAENEYRSSLKQAFNLNQERLDVILNHPEKAKFHAVLVSLVEENLLTDSIFDLLTDSNKLNSTLRFLKNNTLTTQANAVDAFSKIITPGTLEHFFCIQHELDFEKATQLIMEIKSNDQVLEFINSQMNTLSNEPDITALLVALKELLDVDAIKEATSFVLSIFERQPQILNKETIKILTQRANKRNFEIFNVLGTLSKNFVDPERFNILGSNQKLCEVVQIALSLDVFNTAVWDRLITSKQIENIYDFFYAHQFMLHRKDRLQRGTDQGLTLEQFMRIINPGSMKHALLESRWLGTIETLSHELKHRISNEDWLHIFNHVGSQKVLGSLDPENRLFNSHVQEIAGSIFRTVVLGKNSTCQIIQDANEMLRTKNATGKYSWNEFYTIPKSVLSILIPAILEKLPGFITYPMIEAILQKGVCREYFESSPITPAELESSAFYKKYMSETMRMDGRFFSQNPQTQPTNNLQLVVYKP